MLQESIKSNKSQLGKHKEQGQLAFRTMPSPSRLAPHRTYSPSPRRCRTPAQSRRPQEQTNKHALWFVIQCDFWHAFLHTPTQAHTQGQKQRLREKSALPCPCIGQASLAAALISPGRPGRCRCCFCCSSRCKCNLHMHETVADIFADVRGANDSSQGWRNDCATQTTARQARSPKPLHTSQRLRKLKPS